MRMPYHPVLERKFKEVRWLWLKDTKKKFILFLKGLGFL
jgi:hypothetical protein